MNKKKLIFPLALLIYALVFLCALAVGMDYFWDFIDAYEKSRPETALHAYMNALTAEHVADCSADLIAQVDSNLQSEQQCRETIVSTLNKSFTAAKKVQESDEDTQVYDIRCGGTVIGTMKMERNGEEMMGFTVWQVVEDQFDLSFMLKETATITVPDKFTVYALGNQLDSSYITKSGIPYKGIEDLYATYALPTLTTYTAGPFIGNVELTAKDENGNDVVIDKDTDYLSFISNCNDDLVAQMDAAAANFVHLYTAFMSRTGGNNNANYNRLIQHIVPGTDLANRMYTALNGLIWITDRGASVVDVKVNHHVVTERMQCIANITYVVDTNDYSGHIQTTATITVVFVGTPTGLKAEAMFSGGF